MTTAFSETDLIDAADPLTALVTADPPVDKRRRSLGVAATIAAVIAALMIIVALLAPLIAPYAPNVGKTAQRLGGFGTRGHLLGTDGQGRDVLSRLIWGARLSLLTGFIPVAIAGTLGTSFGIIAGLAGRGVHGTIMRTLDVFYAFPAVLLAITIAAALGSGVSNSIVALTVILIPPIARVAETETARLRRADFLEAATASGARRSSVAFRQVLPNVGPAITVYCTTLIGLSIVYAAGLSFLGLGVSPPTAEWGLMISDARQYIYNAPLIALAPAIAILVASITFNVLGDGLRKLLDVRSERFV
jgi:peptide/nickel transport system permease protein